MVIERGQTLSKTSLVGVTNFCNQKKNKKIRKNNKQKIKREKQNKKKEKQKQQQQKIKRKTTKRGQGFLN